MSCVAAAYLSSDSVQSHNYLFGPLKDNLRECF